MKYLSPLIWRRVLVGYGLAGFGVGALNRFLGMIVLKNGGRPGWVTAAAVNLVLPICALCGGWLYPRRRIAAVGGLLLGVGFFLGTQLVATPAFWTWRPVGMAATASPILVVGTLGYAMIGLGATLFARGRRVVGLADQADRCGHCGYLLTGATGDRCPECGVEKQT